MNILSIALFKLGVLYFYHRIQSCYYVDLQYNTVVFFLLIDDRILQLIDGTEVCVHNKIRMD